MHIEAVWFTSLYRADSRFAPSHWETSLQSNAVSHWLGANLESALLTVYPKKYAHGSCFAVLCCGYTLTDFPISTRLTSLALWQSNDCPSASKATLMNMDKYFMWIHYERLHNHNKTKHNKTMCIFLGIYCIVSHCVDKHNTRQSILWQIISCDQWPIFLRKLTQV